MTDEKRDLLTNRTLTERVQRLEQYFIDNLDMRDEDQALGEGFARFAKEVRRGDDMRDEGAKPIPGRGTQAKFNENHSSREYNYKQSAATNQPFEKTLVLEEILQRILMATDNAAEIAGRIEGHGNRYFGPPPMGGDEEENKRSEPRGSIEHMLVALDNLDSTLSRLSVAYSRISGV